MKAKVKAPAILQQLRKDLKKLRRLVRKPIEIKARKKKARRK